MKFTWRMLATLWFIPMFFSFQRSLSQNKDSLFINLRIHSSDIVLLGEPTHGDGSVFDEKLRLIKHLHQNYGFNIIAFESGLYDTFKAHELYSSDIEPISIYNQAVYSMWSETGTFADLLDYVKNNQEMMILGFDSQGFSLFKEYFLDDLKILLGGSNISVSKKTLEQIDQILVSRDFEEFLENREEFDKVIKGYIDILDTLKTVGYNNLKEKVIVQSFESAINDLQYSYDIQMNKKINVQNPRDEQMADNFVFLKNLFPNEKFMLWGANYHFANTIFNVKYTDETRNYAKKMYKLENEITGHNESTWEEQENEIKELRFAKPMGHFLKQKYADKVYSIGFTAYKGNYLGLHEKIFPILPPPDNSIEKKLLDKNLGVFYTDLEDFRNQELYSSNLGYLPILADWSKIFDGICFIPTMHPPRVIEYSETDTLPNLTKEKIYINGQILDALTETPISYADVYFGGNNKSSVSDENGFFSISAGDVGDGFLFFSNLGYLTDSLQINSGGRSSFQKIFLKNDDTTELDEVVVSAKNKLSASNILKEARKRIEKNYVQNPYNQIFKFKVRKFDENSDLSFYEEAILDTYNSKGLYGSNIVENNFFAEILELSYLNEKHSKENHAGVGNLWITLNKDIVLSKSNVLYRSSSYDLTLINTLNYNGRKVYNIQFENNKPGAYSTGYGYPAPKSSVGKIYVDTESYAILKYEHCVVRATYVPKKANYYINTSHKITQTFKEINGYYYINFLEVIDKDILCSKDNNSCKTFLTAGTLVSQDVPLETIKPIKKPIRNIKKGFNINEKGLALKRQEIDITIPVFSNCN